MSCPIQIINERPRYTKYGYNGNLNMWDYGLNPEYKQKLMYQYNNMAKLAQLDTVNSPYYTQVQIDPDYIKFLQNCAKNNNN